jgi:GntR family transcriptional repressor for pyruvate dehydrogenase complex
MREALRLLASSGLVRTSKGPGGGIFVAGTIEQGVARVVTDSVAVLLGASPDLDALLEARGIVEIPLAGLAAERASSDDVRALRSLAAAHESAIGPEEQARAEGELDREIARIAGNALAAALAAWVPNVLAPAVQARIGASGDPRRTRALLLQLVAAIERRDRAGAERAMRERHEHVRGLVQLAGPVHPDPVLEAPTLDLDGVR